MNQSSAPQKVQISAKQFLMLAITYVISTADVFLPAFVAQEAKEDSWIAVIVGTVSALIIANIFVTLAQKYPDKSICEYACDIVGKPAGKIIAVLYLYFFLLVGWSVMRELGEIFVVAFNPDAPVIVFSIIVVVVAAYAVTHGLEAIARINEIMLPVGLLVLLILTAINMPDTDLKNFLPVFYNGFLPSLKGGLLVQSWLIETVFILQLFPHVKEKEKVRKYLNFSIIVTGMGLMVGVLIIAIFGASFASKLMFPALEYVQYASIGPNIQNFDVLIMVVWTGGIFIKISLCYYLGLSALSEIFYLRSYKPLIIPVGFLMIALSLAASNMLIEMIHFLKYIIPFYLLIMAFIIPALLLIISFIRKKAQSASSAPPSKDVQETQSAN